MEIEIRDPSTGNSARRHVSDPLSYQSASMMPISPTTTLDVARDVDDTGYGVEIIIRIGGLEMRRHMGVTPPHEDSDAMHMIAWLDEADALFRAAWRYMEAVDQIR